MDACQQPVVKTIAKWDMRDGPEIMPSQHLVQATHFIGCGQSNMRPVGLVQYSAMPVAPANILALAVNIQPFISRPNGALQA